MKNILLTTLALILALSLAACAGGLGDIVVPSGLSTPNPTNSPGGTSRSSQITESQTQQSNGNIDPALVGTWTMGGSTLQVRKILTGKYDIRGIGFNGISVTGISYTFFENGTYMKIVLGNANLIIVEGKYNVSNNTITLTNNKGKTTTKDDVPIVWESTTSPSNETHSFEIVFTERLDLDILYLDGVNSEPAVGYWFSDDDV